MLSFQVKHFDQFRKSEAFESWQKYSDLDLDLEFGGTKYFCQTYLQYKED